MAEIVFGFGSSHGPPWQRRLNDGICERRMIARTLSTRFGDASIIFRNWLKRGAGKRTSKRNSVSRCVRSDLSAIVVPCNSSPSGWRRSIRTSSSSWRRSDESFDDDIQPSFTIYCGEHVVNAAIDPEKFKTKSPGIALAMSASYPPADQAYPVPVELAHTVVNRAVEDEFDIAVSMKQRTNERGLIGVGHAVGFIYRQILKDRPVPVLPILLNTYFPPNRPTAKRCYQFGQSVGRSIAAWNGPHADKRVAICASGGISHFVVDEDFDTRMLNAIRDRDTQAIFAEPENMFLSGTSETKNWITVAGILSETNLQMKLVDYVPSCRSEAGTDVEWRLRPGNN